MKQLNVYPPRDSPMPHALRIYKALKTAGLSDAESMCVAEEIERARQDPAIYDRESIIDRLCDGGFTEEKSETICAALRNCYFAQRFRTHFQPVKLKTDLVRAKISAPLAEALLGAIDPCVVSLRTAERRQPVIHQLPPGRVVMCDFSFLRKPEMQKERRAIVVSARSSNATGRCAVVPVSKLRAAIPNPAHYEFTPGTYRFFHSTEPVWAICDHIYTVSLERLWMVNVGPHHRPDSSAAITAQHLAGIRDLLGTTLGYTR
ncbi:type II toxin-antitoxin system PemK/MazF family toxin [Bradyrhizobium japonicum]|uniref:type II toxin-antitoxin system PemK/MazF family toxin n=1 Tax=Bradyrhizobium japonicum TaxID=375 RepID=UPI003393150F